MREFGWYNDCTGKIVEYFFERTCDNCEDKEMTRHRGDGIYYSKICDNCYLGYVMSKP